MNDRHVGTDDVGMLVRISRPKKITRRYFVTNGFDGALAMLGLTLSFYADGSAAVETVLQVCLGTAIALMISGVSSAYISESAERRREFRELETAMVSDLGPSAHARAARVIPWMIAVVNGMAPLSVSVVIVLPLWLSVLGVALPIAPLPASIAVAFAVIFLFGIFVGRIGGTSWLSAALRTTAIAAATAGVILLVQA